MAVVVGGLMMERRVLWRVWVCGVGGVEGGGAAGFTFGDLFGFIRFRGMGLKFNECMRLGSVWEDGH